MPERARGGRAQLALVALVFLLPLLAAVWLYYGGDRLRPAGSTNHGVLLSPIVNLGERLPGNRLAAAVADHWALVYLNAGDCDAACRDDLYKLRQSRLMLGNDMNRVLRVFLHGLQAPDTVFLDQQHRGMLVLGDADTAALLAAQRPGQVAAGGYFLLDPLGNVVMYFAPGTVPRNLVDDVAHLLELSRIG